MERLHGHGPACQQQAVGGPPQAIYRVMLYRLQALPLLHAAAALKSTCGSSKAKLSLLCSSYLPTMIYKCLRPAQEQSSRLHATYLSLRELRSVGSNGGARHRRHQRQH